MTVDAYIVFAYSQEQKVNRAVFPFLSKHFGFGGYLSTKGVLFCENRDGAEKAEKGRRECASD